MTAPLRSAAKLFLILQIPFLFACSDTAPGGAAGPVGSEPDAARFAGLLTVSEGTADAGSGEAFRAATALGGARIDLVSQGGAVATLHTSGSGAFSASLASGAYTVRIPMSDGPPLEFSLDLPARGALFAEGRVDRTPSGVFTLNVQIFRDADADAHPDDAFRVQILDRVQGNATSGFEDVVTSQVEAEEQVTLCHVPPGNPDAAHTIVVGAPAVPVHLAHGDTEGPCADETGDDEDPEDEEEEIEDEQDEDAGQTLVLVCHVPPGNPDNPVTIEIAEPALPAHLAHGDTEGPCADDTDAGDEDPEDEEQDEQDEDAGQTLVLVCHVPPGNPNNPVTIEIAEAALPAHLAHGDTEGPCAGDTGPTEEDEG